jgi:MFS family permease
MRNEEEAKDDPKGDAERAGESPSAVGAGYGFDLATDPSAPLISTTTPAERKRAFRILFVSLICLGMGQSLMFAILPPLARELGLAEYLVQSIFAASAVIWVVMSPIWGRRSDVWGRKPVILVGLLGYAASTILFATSISAGLVGLLPLAIVFPLMILTRSMYGLLGPGAMAGAQAYVADRTSRNERTAALATIAAAFGLGLTLGPGVGAAVAEIGLLAPLYLVAILALFSAFAIWRYLPERSPPRERGDMPKMRILDRRIRPFLAYGLIMGIAAAIPIQTVAFFFMDMLEIEARQAPQYAGVALMASSMAMLFAQLVVVQRFDLSAPMLMWMGAAIALVGNAVFVFSTNYGALVFALVLTGLGFGMARPGFMAGASLAVSREEQGAVAGITGATGAAGFIFVPVISFFLYTWTPVAPYALNVLLMVVLIAMTMLSKSVRAVGDVLPPASGQGGTDPH